MLNLQNIASTYTHMNIRLANILYSLLSLKQNKYNYSTVQYRPAYAQTSTRTDAMDLNGSGVISRVAMIVSIASCLPIILNIILKEDNFR